MSIEFKKLNITFIEDNILKKTFELSNDDTNSIYIVTYDINSTDLQPYYMDNTKLQFPIPIEFQYKKIYYDFEVLTKLYSVGEKHSINISSRSDVEQVKEKITRIYQHYNDISHIKLKKLTELTEELKKKIPENSSKEGTNVEIIINYYADWEGGSRGKGPNRSTIINIINNYDSELSDIERDKIIKIIYNSKETKNNYDVFKEPTINQTHILEQIYNPILENDKSSDLKYGRIIKYNSNTERVIKEYLQYVSDVNTFKDIKNEYDAILYYNIYNIYKYFYLHGSSVLVYKDRLYTIQNIEPVKFDNNFKITSNSIEISFKLNLKQEISTIPSISIRYILIDNDNENEVINIRLEYYNRKKQLSLLNNTNFNKNLKMSDKFFIDETASASAYSETNFISINKNINKNLEPIEFFVDKYNFLLFHNNLDTKKRSEYNKILFSKKQKQKNLLKPPYNYDPEKNKLSYTHSNTKDQNKFIEIFIKNFLLKKSNILYIDNTIYEIIKTEFILADKSVGYNENKNYIQTNSSRTDDKIMKIKSNKFNNKLLDQLTESPEEDDTLSELKRKLRFLIGEEYIVPIIIYVEKINENDTTSNKLKRKALRAIGIKSYKNKCYNRLRYLDFNLNSFYNFIGVNNNLLYNNFNSINNINSINPAKKENSISTGGFKRLIKFIKNKNKNTNTKKYKNYKKNITYKKNKL